MASALSRRLRAIRVHGGDRGGGGGGVDGDSDDDWDESDEWSESEDEEMGFDLFGDTELLSDKVTKELEAVPVSGKISTTTKISDSDLESIFLAQQQVRHPFCVMVTISAYLFFTTGWIVGSK